jgi:threonine dehydratase
MRLPDPDDVRRAAGRIRGHAHRTPVLTSRALSERLEADLFFKCENFQRAGAFKFRGACNAVLAAAGDTLAAGVAAHSSGNHAAALSLAAGLRSVPAVIVMPDDAPAVKKRAVAGYGARIVYCAPTLESREQTLRSIVEAEHLHVVHPYDDEDVIAGQGTAALELLADVPGLETVIAPVGGGGLLAGTALAAAGAGDAVHVVGAEPAAADDAYRSLAAGRRLPVGRPATIADGLRTSLGERNFELLRHHRVTIATASEAGIVTAMRLVWERMKLVIEPSAALPLAVLLERRDAVPGRRIGIVLSGGNVDLDRLPWHP